MNEIIINYNDSKTQKMLSLLVGGYASLFGLYQAVLQALDGIFSFDFFIAVILIVLGGILILNVTVWVSRPILELNSNRIYVNIANQKTVYRADWISVREVSLGISYLKILETDGKQYTVDLSGLKYEDLKKVKGLIVEFCESKSIPYKKD